MKTSLIVALLISLFLCPFAIAENTNDIASSLKPDNLVESDLLLTDSIYDSSKKNDLNVDYNIGETGYVYIDEEGVQIRQTLDIAVIPYITIEADSKEEFIKKQNDKIVSVMEESIGATVDASMDSLIYDMNMAQAVLFGLSKQSTTLIIMHPKTFNFIFPTIEHDVAIIGETTYYAKIRVVFTELIKMEDVIFLASKKKAGIIPIKKRYDGKSGTFGIMMRQGFSTKATIKE